MNINDFLPYIITVFALLIPPIKDVVIKIQENKKISKDLLVRMAIKNWENHQRLAEKLAEKKGTSVPMFPLDAYLIHLSNVMKLIDKDKLTKENIKELYNQNQEVSQIIKNISKNKNTSE